MKYTSRFGFVHLLVVSQKGITLLPCPIALYSSNPGRTGLGYALGLQRVIEHFKSYQVCLGIVTAESVNNQLARDKNIEFSTMKTAKIYDFKKLDGLLNAEPEHPHIHNVDMPFRIASIWQDHGCEVGVWEKNDQVLAWAIFQPAWWNLDFAIHPAVRGSELEQEIFAWGKDQMMQYACHTGEEFWGSVEIFADAPQVSQTLQNLEAVGFTPFDWSTLRFELELSQELPQAQLPQGFTIRPLRGVSEVPAYVDLHRAAFGSEKMTIAWRQRTLQQPAYRSEIDLIIENDEKIPVGFCICWLRDNIGQIEPLGIHPDYQGLGLGKALELSAYHIFRNYGARLIKVDHVSLNKSAIALSQKTGFQTRHNALRYYVQVACP